MKRTKCIVRNCESGPDSEVTFFPLPKEAVLRRRWLEAANLSETDVNKRSKVCSKHFKKGDFAKSAKNSDPAKRISELQPEAVPSINLPLKSTFKIKISKKDNNKELKVEEVKVKEEKDKVKMPKKAPAQYAPKVEVMPAPRTHARRAASKEALKQMQLLLDDEDDAVEIPDEDIQLIEPSPPPPPKKKYKISHRKSADGNADREVLVLKTITNRNAENTLELDCWVEQLDEVQQNRLKKRQAEEKEIEQKLKQLLNSPHAKVVHKGDLSTIVEITETRQLNHLLHHP
ncbi:unnamed protein product [Acanthoscelides obtectus]|uniref:THAP-type domain-containing protein n=1 Tax=Acanthoscelides obtectus TaxID=200917 RepID=A0A9P0VS32_ACAOB|nr:unnamed protein product [Acanthoscelides obtectus]CAK1659884.1 hypothetical protein AOBTE_LOCUS21728 [Acanthoscelides obtectus]